MTDEIKPDEDIDVMHDVDKLRIERMNDESLWFAGYRDEGPDLHFNVLCTEDGLTIHTWHDSEDDERYQDEE